MRTKTGYGKSGLYTTLVDNYLLGVFESKLKFNRLNFGLKLNLKIDYC
jgi:hypothetical protein